MEWYMDKRLSIFVILAWFLCLQHTEGNSPSAAQSPEAAPDSFQSDTTLDTLAGYIEFAAEEGLVVSSFPSNQTSNTGWNIYAAIRNRNFGFTLPEAAWFMSGGAQFIRSPWLENGAGSALITNTVRFATEGEYAIQASTNGTNWTQIETVRVDSTAWQEYRIPLRMNHGVYLRFVPLDSNTIGFDSISLSPPVAQVAIDNVETIPRFPSQTEPVYISARITSISSFSPASNIAANVTYIIDGNPPRYGPPLFLDRIGDSDLYQTAEPIDPVAAGKRVDYNIEVEFSGYEGYYGASPTTSPAQDTGLFHSYTPRQYASDYSFLQLGRIDQEAINMELVADRTWECILPVLATHSSPAVTFRGYVSNPGDSPLEPDIYWGDLSNAGATLPILGTASAGSAPTTLHLTAPAHYLVRFHEDTRAYSMEPVAYQNFSEWLAPSRYFTGSHASPNNPILHQHFEPAIWPLSEPRIQFTDFGQGWESSVQPYPYANFEDFIEQVTEADPFVLYDAAVIQQPVGRAAIFTEYPRSGILQTAIPEGLGSVAIDIRAAAPHAFAPAVYLDSSFTNIRVTAMMQAFDVPAGVDGQTQSLGNAYKSVIAGYLDENNFYEARLATHNSTQKRFELWMRREGTNHLLNAGSLVGGGITAYEPISLHVFRSSPTQDQLRIYQGTVARSSIVTVNAITNGFGIGVSGMDTAIITDSISVTPITSVGDTTTQTPLFTENFDTPDSTFPSQWLNPSSHWTLAGGNVIHRNAYLGVPLQLRLSYSTNLIHWTTLQDFAPLTNSPYQRLTITPQLAQGGHIRIEHREGTGYIITDRIRLESWCGRNMDTQDGWSVNRGWITDAAAENRGHVLELQRSRAVPGDAPFLLSPMLTNGVNTLAFDYSTDGTGPYVLDIEAGVFQEGTTNLNWQTVATITNAAPDWERVDVAINDPDTSYIRFRNHASHQRAVITLDAIAIRDALPPDSNSWIAYNTRISSDTNLPVFMAPDDYTSAFLNHGPGPYSDTPVAQEEHAPYIESPILPNGIREVRFAYCQAAGSTPGIIHVIAAPSRETPRANWKLLATIEDVEHSAYHSFQQTYQEWDLHVIRIENDSSTGSRIGLDNILIRSYNGASLRIRDLQTDPAIPIIGDTVHLEAEVYDFQNNPSNIVMQAYWRAGTNVWGQQDGMQLISMLPTAQGAGWVRFRTETPIPAQPLDEVVQYLVETTFTGTLHEELSPIIYRHFKNPSWYEPLNLNADQAHPIPYYLTLSSPPAVHTIQYITGPGGRIEGPVTQSIIDGGSTTPVQAIADEGAAFSGWDDGITEATRADHNIRVPATYAASFTTMSGTPISWYEQHNIERDIAENWSELDLRVSPSKGLTLRQEYIALTDPNDPDSVFRVVGIHFDPHPAVIVEPSSTNRFYKLAYTTNLVMGSWQDVPRDYHGSEAPFEGFVSEGPLYITATVGLAPPPRLTMLPWADIIPFEGGSAHISVSANVPWDADVDAGWVSVHPWQDHEGNGYIDCHIEPNPAHTSRTAAVTVTGGGLTRTRTITQAGSSSTEP
jgi:hypothetical protein